MAKNCTLLENSSIPSFETVGEDEIELSLGLSIGGNFRKESKSSPIQQKTERFEFESTDIETDPQRKREIQARKKRGEKAVVVVGNGVSRERNGDEACLEAQWLRGRAREREMRENETCGVLENEEMRDLNKTELDRKRSSSPAGYSCPAFQYLPSTNGSGYPNVIPGRVGDVIRPVVFRSFQPYHNNNAEYVGNGNGNEVLNGSPGRSSSDNRSKSQQEGSSKDSRSPSYHSQQKHHQNSKSREQSEHSSYCSQTDHTQAIDKTTNFPEKVVSSNTTPPSGMNSENPSSGPLKRDNIGDMSRPPKPQMGNQDSASMSQMPCVSTTGNGPNGKTITGFLYRYTKTEVSIICVCHGSTFSPSEFVTHAGGTDISHPLRHITVVPSAFG